MRIPEVSNRFSYFVTMKFSFKILLSLLFILAGCTDPQRETAITDPDPRMLTDGQRIDVVGTAAALPDHANKANGHGISTATESLLFSGDYEPISEDIIGLAIRVRGVVEEKRLPMFEHPNDGSPAPAGIPVPIGTDIEKASRYFVIVDPVWEVAD